MGVVRVGGCGGGLVVVCVCVCVCVCVLGRGGRLDVTNNIFLIDGNAKLVS